MGIGWEENAAKMVMTTRDYEVLTHSPTTVPSFLFSKKRGGGMEEKNCISSNLLPNIDYNGSSFL